MIVFDVYSYIENGENSSLSCVGRLRFEQFNLANVLANSTHLMASEGKEFDIEEDSSLGMCNCLYCIVIYLAYTH